MHSYQTDSKEVSEFNKDSKKTSLELKIAKMKNMTAGKKKKKSSYFWQTTQASGTLIKPASCSLYIIDAAIL